MFEESKLYEALGRRVRVLREGEGRSGRLTQAALAYKVGLERTSITNIEKGAQKVPLHVLYKICDALGAQMNDLLPSPFEIQTPPEAVNLDELGLDPLLSATPKLARKLRELMSSEAHDSRTER